jgi:hypothetical protein
MTEPGDKPGNGADHPRVAGRRLDHFSTSSFNQSILQKKLKVMTKVVHKKAHETQAELISHFSRRHDDL